MNIIDIIFFAVLLIVAVVGLIRGFMKNGLNNLCTVAIIGLTIILSPVIVRAFGSAVTAVESWLSFLKEETMRASVANGVMTFLVAIVLLIVLSIIFCIIKKILRKFITPKRKVGKAIDKVLGMVFGVALYGSVLLILIGSICTVEPVKQYAANSFVEKNNIFAGFCEENLNLGKLFTKNEDDDKNGDGESGEGEDDLPEKGEEN